LTVPYEGGHPDHDATAFAVHRACAGMEAWKRPVILEMLSYHHSAGMCQMSVFIDEEKSEVLTVHLSAAEKRRKRELFECFVTQQTVLQWFPTELEKVRIAPNYDFTRPPHAGTLYYELFPWGIDGASWRELARRTLTDDDRLHRTRLL